VIACPFLDLRAGRMAVIRATIAEEAQAIMLAISRSLTECSKATCSILRRLRRNAMKSPLVRLNMRPTKNNIATPPIEDRRSDQQVRCFVVLRPGSIHCHIGGLYPVEGEVLLKGDGMGPTVG